MSSSVESTQHLYFAQGSENPAAQEENSDQSSIAQQGYVYYQQPIQQYASFYPGQQYHPQYGVQPTPVASPTIDPTTGQPSVVQYAQGVAPNTPQASPAPSPIPSRRSRGIQDSGPYFRDTEQIHRIFSSDRNRQFKLRLFPKIDRGFFLTDNDWTCYRRNYFQVSSSFTALDASSQRLELPCFIQTETGWWTITQFLINVSAKTSTNTRDIELVQHTAKRDKGPQLIPQPRPCDPQSAPVLNFRQDPESRAVVTFERLQFKSATANNGKRRAAQQYHIIVMELFARCDNGSLIKVALCESAPLVVRGRAPGHYAQIGSTKSGTPSPYEGGMYPSELTNVDVSMMNGQMQQVLTSPGGSQVYPAHYTEMHPAYYQYQYPQQQGYQYAQQFNGDPGAWYGRQDEDRPNDETGGQIHHGQPQDGDVETYVTEVGSVDVDHNHLHIPGMQAMQMQGMQGMQGMQMQGIPIHGMHVMQGMQLPGIIPGMQMPEMQHQDMQQHEEQHNQNQESEDGNEEEDGTEDDTKKEKIVFN